MRACGFGNIFAMNTGIKVGDCMKTSLASVSEDSTVVEAAKMLQDRKVGSLLVFGPKRNIYGILTERDLVTKALASGRIDIKVKDICTKKLLTITVNADISQAAQLMGEKSIKRIVVTSNEKIVGIVSQKDLITISPSLYSSIAQVEANRKLKIY